MVNFVDNNYVVGIGGICIDRFYETHQWPEIGSKTLVNSKGTFIGGMIPNVLSNMSIQGIDTYLVDTLPTNEYYDEIVDDLNNYNVNHEYCVLDKKTKPYESLIINYNGEKTIFVVEGNKSSLQISNHLHNLIVNSSFVYTIIPDIKSIKNGRKIYKEWIKQGVNFVFDLEEGTFESKESDKLFFESAAILIFNEYGFKKYIGNEILENIIEEFSIRNQIVVVTKGEKGYDLYIGNKCISGKGIKSNVVDTTGAGDCFNGTFLANILKGNTAIESAIIANKTAAEFVSVRGPKMERITSK